MAKAKKRLGDSFDEAKFRETNPRVIEHQQKRDALHERYTAAMQGTNLEELKKIGGKQVFLVVGKTDVEVRDEVKKITESNDNVIILASYGVFAEGISIRNLHNIILASPTKSYRRIVQTIGRGLRITNTKKSCTIYDLVDLFFESGTNDEPNFTFRHFKERLMIYIKSDFRHKTIQVPFTP